MVTASPTREEWTRLYDASIAVKSMAPWDWMEEIDLFGVQNPETGEIGFVSVMGLAGEHFAVSVYLGAEGLYKFLDFQDTYPNVHPSDLLLIPQLMASFEDRAGIEKEDYAVIKQLGYKFRGHHAWPLFRDYYPGLAPWFIDAPQARFLTYALEQLLELAPRYKENHMLLDGIEDIEQYLVRVPNADLEWADRIMPVKRPAPQLIEIKVAPSVLKAFKKLPQNAQYLEAACFMMPTQIGERGTRPYFPFAVLIVEPVRGMVVGMELLQPLPSVEEMWTTVPEVMLRQLTRAKVRPGSIVVGSPMLAELMAMIASETKVEVEMSYSLPALDFARRELEMYLRR